MAHGHIKTICRKCGITISQCRCMDKGDKEVKLAICPECKEIELRSNCHKGCND